MPHVCDRCGAALRRRTRATSHCPGCDTTFYVDSDDGRPIHRHPDADRAFTEEGAEAASANRTAGEDHPDQARRP